MQITFKNLKWDSELVKKFWDYHSQFPEQYFANQFKKGLILSFKKYLKNKEYILDFGCGPGFLIDELINNTSRNSKIFGLDVSVKSLNKVNTQFKNEMKFKGAFSPKILLKRKIKFDVIIMVETIEHLNEKEIETVFIQIQNLLRKNGILIITCPNNEDLSLSEVYCPKSNVVFHKWQHMWSIDKIKMNSLLKKKQYTPIIIKGTNFSNVGLLSKAKNFIRYILNKNYNPHLLSIAKKN